VANM